MARLLEYKLVKKHFGAQRPGEAHKMHNVGTSIYAPAEGPGALPPLQDYAVPVDAPPTKKVESDAVAAAQARVKAARAELKKADKDGDAAKRKAAEEALAAAETEADAAAQAAAEAE